MSAEPAPPEAAQPSRSAYTVAGFLSAMAIFAALIGIAWHPLRLIIPAMLISLVAAAMAPKGNRLAQVAVAVAAASFFVGMLVSVVTQRALW